jgi:hypothetical protein
MCSAREEWLPTLLTAVEAAAPVDAVRVFADGLGRLVEAVEVSFLIADFSGRSLIRLIQSSAGRR